MLIWLVIHLFEENWNRRKIEYVCTQMPSLSWSGSQWCILLLVLLLFWKENLLIFADGGRRRCYYSDVFVMYIFLELACHQASQVWKWIWSLITYKLKHLIWKHVYGMKSIKTFVCWYHSISDLACPTTGLNPSKNSNDPIMVSWFILYPKGSGWWT